MPSNIGIGNDKVPADGSGYRSDGDTIPFSAAGGEKIGAVVVRLAGTQAIGVVQALTAQMENAAATAGDEIQLRVAGMFYLPIAEAAYDDGATVAWSSTDMAANATGAHQIVGAYESGDTHACVRINVNPGAAT